MRNGRRAAKTQPSAHFPRTYLTNLKRHLLRRRDGPAGGSDINPDVNAVQLLVAALDERFFSTPHFSDARTTEARDRAGALRRDVSRATTRVDRTAAAPFGRNRRTFLVRRSGTSRENLASEM